MPEGAPSSTYDSSIIKSEPRKPITLESQAAHEESLKTEVPMADLVRVLKALVPDKSASLDSRLAKYQEGKLAAPGAFTLLKTDVGPDKMISAFEELAPGYDRVHVRATCYPHPIVV
jgi:hypothetical protein